MAVCEVIDHKIKKQGTIWVVPNEDYVLTRFFLISDDINRVSLSNALSTVAEPLKSELQHCLQSHGLA